MADYVLAQSVQIFSHYQARPRHMRDRAQPDRLDLAIAVRSGDYFVTLATSIESLATTLPDISTATASKLLAKIADDLCYLQTHYRIECKDRSDDITELG